MSVLPEYRRRGVGTALYVAISAWARERGLDTIQTIVDDDDPESLGFAQRRGFAEHSHEKGVSLDLTRIEPPTVEPPEGVEIATWAERPELARGMYEVVLEAAPDIPGGEDERSSRSSTGSRTTCRAPATGRRRRSSRSPATR